MGGGAGAAHVAAAHGALPLRTLAACCLAFRLLNALAVRARHALFATAARAARALAFRRLRHAAPTLTGSAPAAAASRAAGAQLLQRGRVLAEPGGGAPPRVRVRRTTHPAHQASAPTLARDAAPGADALRAPHNAARLGSYGYLTWEWFAALRGWAHPLLFAALYRALALVGADTPAALALAPRLLQACFAAGGDVATYALGRRLFGERAARGALACVLSSWFSFYGGARTFSSSLEAPLCAAALALWPWPAHVGSAGGRGQRAQPGARPVAALALAAAACVARPSAGALWLPLAAAEALGGAGRCAALLRRAVPVGALALAAAAALDRALYGFWVCVPWRFLSFNLLSGGAAAYGTHPWHWYATSGGPTALGALTPLVVASAALARRGRRALPAAAVLCAAALSGCAHKEFRFLLPLLPPACVYAGALLAALHDGVSPPGLRCGRRFLARARSACRVLLSPAHARTPDMRAWMRMRIRRAGCLRAGRCRPGRHAAGASPARSSPFSRCCTPPARSTSRWRTSPALRPPWRCWHPRRRRGA
jgi:hypothetical protein